MRSGGRAFEFFQSAITPRTAGSEISISRSPSPLNFHARPIADLYEWTTSVIREGATATGPRHWFCSLAHHALWVQLQVSATPSCIIQGEGSGLCFLRNLKHLLMVERGRSALDWTSRHKTSEIRSGVMESGSCMLLRNRLFSFPPGPEGLTDGSTHPSLTTFAVKH